MTIDYSKMSVYGDTYGTTEQDLDATQQDQETGIAEILLPNVNTPYLNQDGGQNQNLSPEQIQAIIDRMNVLNSEENAPKIFTQEQINAADTRYTDFITKKDPYNPKEAPSSPASGYGTVGTETNIYKQNRDSYNDNGNGTWTNLERKITIESFSPRYTDIIEDKRYYKLPVDCLKVKSIKVLNHRNNQNKYAKIPRLIHEPVDQDGDEF